MKQRNLILVAWLIAGLLHGENATNRLVVVRLKACTLFINCATGLDCSTDCTSNLIAKVLVKDKVCNNSEIVGIINRSYKKGCKRKREWGDWYDYMYANQYWGVYDMAGNPLYLLCYFEKTDGSVTRTNVFWGVTGLRDMSYFDEKVAPICEIYQISKSDKWDGTFESQRLEELLIEGSWALNRDKRANDAVGGGIGVVSGQTDKPDDDAVGEGWSDAGGRSGNEVKSKR